MKICPKCGTEKDLSEFWKDKSNNDGLCCWCKDCKKLSIINAPSRKNIEKTREYNREYRAKNKEKISQRHKDYVEKTRERRREYTREWQKNRRKSDPEFRLKANIKKSVYNNIKRTGTVKGGKTFNIIGLTVDEIKSHLESKFKEGMSWENYGEWHIDHIKPQCLFDFTDQEQIKKCWALENLQPLWAEENLKKNNKYEGV